MRRARRGGREVSFVVLVHQDHEKEKKRTESTGVRFRHPRLSFAHLRLAQLRFATGTLVRRGDLSPVREVLVRPPLPTPRGDLIVVRDSVLVQERAPRHRAVPRAPSGRTKIGMGRVFADDEETRPRVRERSRTRLSSRGRFRGATRFRRLAREASTAARSPVSAGDSARARRRRARLGLDEVSRGMGKRVPSEESSNQRADNLRAKFALWSMFSRFGLQSFGRGIRTRVNNSCRDLWDHRPTRVSAVFPFFSGAPKRCVRTRG